ncbi:MAG: TIGR02757 family protein [Cyclobacteriaceae bacterium]|nr:TIGR02757 family protein [Cyclobacteriaceae bacterium]
MRKALPASELKALLDEQVARFNARSFIALDPVSVPHRYSQRRDIEIAGLFAATIAWGNRASILKSAERLMTAMDDAPGDFVVNHTTRDLTRFNQFVHRTFQSVDLRYFLKFLQSHYRQHGSLEPLFAVPEDAPHVHDGLVRFHDAFFSLPRAPQRTRKHVATPMRGSACKRLNMFLRWMVRRDDKGVDFGIWQSIRPAQLICPLDVHVANVARELRLLRRKQNDWEAAVELTNQLKLFSAEDPVQYDFALFGLGVTGRQTASDS